MKPIVARFAVSMSVPPTFGSLLFYAYALWAEVFPAGWIDHSADHVANVTFIIRKAILPCIGPSLLAWLLLEVFRKRSRGVPVHSGVRIGVGVIVGMCGGCSIPGFWFGPSREMQTYVVFSMIGAIVGGATSLLVWRHSTNSDTKKKTAEPGATDNPDDAQRLREDH